MIEWSNTGNDNEWKILDSQNNLPHLDDSGSFHRFKIGKNLSEDESYRFLGLWITGQNYAGNKQLCITALEYFGSLI